MRSMGFSPPINGGATYADLFGIVLLISSIICSYTHGSTPADMRADGRLLLKENWKIQPSTQARSDGKEISTAGFRTDDWYPATVPSTVLAALVDAQVFLDPYYGLNLRSLPGATNPIGSEDFMLRADAAGESIPLAVVVSH